MHERHMGGDGKMMSGMTMDCNMMQDMMRDTAHMRMMMNCMMNMMARDTAMHRMMHNQMMNDPQMRSMMQDMMGNMKMDSSGNHMNMRH